MKTKLQLMEDAWRDYPSQDNEGYQPERGSFKCGFFSGFDARDAEVAKLREMVKASREGLEFYAMRENWQRSDDDSAEEDTLVAYDADQLEHAFKSKATYGKRARATLARLDEMEGK